MGARRPRVAILGAGFGGLCMAIRLKAAGLTSFTVYEKGQDLGGTWRDNTYPGLACDVPSYLYSYSFAPYTGWTRRYPEQPEILAYLRLCARRFGLEPHLRFGTEITEAVFDEDAGLWRLRTGTGEQIEAEIVVSALGQLNRPHLPDLPGAADFAGTWFHSARWDHGHDLTGRSVAVIGNGASAVQFVPRIAPLAGRLSVFQRSATWVFPKTDFPYPKAAGRALRLRAVNRAYRQSIYWRQEMLFYVLRGGRLAAIGERRAADHLREQVADEALRETLTPDYPIGCKRIVISNDFYPALARDNVEVVTEPISRIMPDGIVTADGTHRPVDTIVYGTGFRATEFLVPMEVTGRGGRRLADTWRDGAYAYLGMTVPGFPNFFLLYGPNTNLGHNSIVLMLEWQTRYVLQCVQALVGRDLAWLDVREDVTRRYDAEIRAGLRRTVWEAGCTSWYKTPTGKVTNNWPLTTVRYRREVRRPRLEDYHLAARRQEVPAAP
ncbi:flavin-containing monooxygenase [Actinomadura scrupuli]|uniref:flavin-containing monooxygenase n=1 Tax=Actinomadura scrupuli TaxID=559629 RepID=UPI003D9954A2